MAYNFSELNTKTKEVSEWLSKEYLSIRTGRATPALLDNIQIESYGAKVPINQVASVSVEDARSLRVTPWDTTQISAIGKAITDANLGVGVSSDDSGVRVSFPEVTSERRLTLIKLAKDKLEHAKVSLRTAREDTWNEIQKKEKEGEMGEDEKFTAKDDMQKIINEANKNLDGIYDKKEKEISS
ncbi:MAG: ribosome recycling factor [Parcubacteria group bacterium]|nr:ribosome recycling factor [Parcubacteria group bacterium]